MNQSDELLDLLPIACYRLNELSEITYVNQHALKLFGLHKEDCLRSNIWDLFPESKATHCFTAINAALNYQQTTTHDYVSAVTQCWIRLTATPVNKGVVVSFIDIHDLKLSEKEKGASETAYHALFDAIDEGFCIIEKITGTKHGQSDFRYLNVNPAFSRHTGLLDAQGKTIRELVPNMEIKILDCYDLVVTTGNPQHFEEYVSDLNLWIEAKVFPLPVLGQLAIVFNNFSARKKAEIALKETESRLSLIFEVLPIGIGFTDANGKLMVCNPAMHHYLPNGMIPSQDKERQERWQSWDAEGKLIQAHDFPGARALRGEYVVPGMELLYKDDTGKKRWTQVAGVPVKDAEGNITGQVNFIYDIDGAKRSNEALRKSEERLRLFITASSSMVYRMSADWKEMYNLNGKNILADTENTTGIWTEKYIPQEDESAVKQTIQKAIQNKSIFDLEHRVMQADGSIGWIHSRAVPVLNVQGDITEWLGAGNDITARKQAEAALRESDTKYRIRLEREVIERTTELGQTKDLLQGTLDSSPNMIQVFKAVRDDKGNIVDFIWVLNNQTSEQVHGHVIGESLLQHNPGVIQTGIFNNFVEVTETGIPRQYEKHYTYEQFDGWFNQSVVKLNDGVATTTADITLRKKAEEERFRNFLLLQQSEEVAQTGTWDFNLLNGAFSWSDGMYRIFDLEHNAEVKPEIYLQYATDGSQEAAQRIVHHLQTGDQDFEETTEISAGGKIKVLHLKASVVRNPQGEPVRVLGVDMDITAMREAEHRLRQMESRQQQEIFQVTLNTQEEERRRISESLHNGLGQLLFGIKLSMNYLTAKTAGEKPDQFHSSRTYTEQLLTDAIRETRRISHELMPTVLAEFGLDAAIKDICEQMQDSTKFVCNVSLGSIKLDNYQELAIFRTVQELIINVIKHAKATRAKVQVTAEPGEVLILVRDNGQGIAAAQKDKPGIGLSSIRSKVDLLKGSVDIESALGEGTTVKVRMPFLEYNEGEKLKKIL